MDFEGKGIKIERLRHVRMLKDPKELNMAEFSRVRDTEDFPVLAAAIIMGNRRRLVYLIKQKQKSNIPQIFYWYNTSIKNETMKG